MSSWYHDEGRFEAWSQIKVASGMVTTLRYRATDSKDIKQFQRLWWSCFIQHQTMAFCMQQTPSMQYPQCGITMISEQDFELLPDVATSTKNNTDNATGVNDTTICCASHISGFVEFAKLTIILGCGRTRHIHYGTLPVGGRVTCSQASDGLFQEALTFQTRLMTWYQKLPRQFKDYPCWNEMRSGDGKRNHEVSQILSASMMIIYYLTLVRENNSSNSSPISEELVLDRAHTKSSAEEGAMEVLHNLSEQLLLPHIPTCLIDGLVCLAIKRFLAAEIVRVPCADSSIRGFECCLQVLQVMHNRFQMTQQESLDFRISLLQTMHYLRKENRLVDQGEKPTPNDTPSLMDYTSCDSETYADPDTVEPIQLLPSPYGTDHNFQDCIDRPLLGVPWSVLGLGEPLPQQIVSLSEPWPSVPDWFVGGHGYFDKLGGRVAEHETG